jgi:HK97 gp10 family phage protein
MAERIVFNERALDELFESPNGPVAKDLARRAIRVRTAAMRLAPVDTGRLRSSISHELAADARGFVATIGTNVDYAAHVELGTSRMRAQPYLRPALDAAR